MAYAELCLVTVTVTKYRYLSNCNGIPYFFPGNERTVTFKIVIENITKSNGNVIITYFLGESNANGIIVTFKLMKHNFAF